MSAETVHVPLGERAYDVHVGVGLLDDVGPVAADANPDARTAALVSQQPVREHAERVAASLHAAGLEPRTIDVPDGEKAKSPEVLVRLWEELAAIPLGRRDLVVAVGGGVVGDLAGFAAASWHRGVDVVQVPTTLLAQVDAAVGGKTGINLPAGKNLVGAFHQPRGVVCDVGTLRTLAERDLVAGLAEVVKCGLIRDPVILERLEERSGEVPVADPEVLVELVARAVAVKATVVAADERETGEREHLNLGHTLGHALETVTSYEELRHGEAVAIGTCFALRLGVRLGRTPPDLVPRTEGLLEALGLPTRTDPHDREELWGAMQRDKKARGDVRFVLLDGLGRPSVSAVDRAMVEEALAEVEEGSA